jgi:hypothetical protein
MGSPKNSFFVLNEFVPAPSIEGDSKRRWDCPNDKLEIFLKKKLYRLQLH